METVGGVQERPSSSFDKGCLYCSEKVPAMPGAATTKANPSKPSTLDLYFLNPDAQIRTHQTLNLELTTKCSCASVSPTGKSSAEGSCMKRKHGLEYEPSSYSSLAGTPEPSGMNSL